MRYTFWMLFLIILGSCDSMPEKKILYKSDSYTLTNYDIQQGNLNASFVGIDEIHSNYFNEPRELKFKFSINGEDNEMGFGVDHLVILKPNENGRVDLPIISYGVQLSSQNPENEDPTFLEPNTKVKFQVDLNPVIEAITRDGKYVSANGQEITEIRSISILGSKPPLDWDFAGANNKLTDQTGDGIYSIELPFNQIKVNNGNRVWKRKNDVSTYPQLTSQLPLIDALYMMSLDELEELRTENGYWDTGAKWSGVWTRDMSYSILLSLAYLDPETSKACLRAKVKNDRIIQDTGTGGSWPISSDRMTWSLAAWEIYVVTGNKEWLKEARTILTNSVEDDLKSVLSPDSLIYGETSFADWREQSYPAWMQPIDIYTSEGADNNMVHARTYEILADMYAEDRMDSLVTKYDSIKTILRHNINSEFWDTERGYYKQFTYTNPYKSTSPKAMALAESFAILFDIANDKQQIQIASATPVVEWGIPTIYPQIPEIPAYHNNGIWPFVQSFWNWSLAKVKNEKALVHGLSSIYRAAALFLTNKENMRADNGNDYPTQINSDRQLWSVAGNLAMPYRVFLGMNFKPNGIQLNPSIPQVYEGDFNIQNFTYRNANLSFEIEGFGSSIKSIKLDGKILEQAFIPSNLSGNHIIEIQMTNLPFTPKAFNLVDNKFHLKTPQVELTNDGIAWDSIPGAVSYEIRRNGVSIDSVDVFEFQARREATVADYQVRALANDELLHSFWSAPISKTLPSAIIWIESERYGTRQRDAENYRGYGFVKLDIGVDKTSDIQHLVYPSRAGEYWLDFRYSNGNGPINTENKTGIRSVYVNDEWVGTAVFPQRGTDEWSNWGFSQRIKVNINTGRNTVRLQYDDFNANMNGEINGFWLDAMRLVRSE